METLITQLLWLTLGGSESGSVCVFEWTDFWDDALLNQTYVISSVVLASDEFKPLESNYKKVSVS